MGYGRAFSTIVAVSLVFITVSYFIYRKTQKKGQKRSSSDSQWELVGAIEEISMYPIQSGAALLIPKAKCSKFGLTINGIRGRFLVLFNEHDELAFSGTFPTMLSIATEIVNESSLIVRAPNKEPLSLNLVSIAQRNPVIVKQRKGLKMSLIECDSEHHEWFSTIILQRKKGLQLFISLEPKLQFNMLGVDMSDFNPIMLMNNKSVRDLNKRLPDTAQVHHLQFRGNILLKSLDNIEAYDEDDWSWLKIGDTADSCILQYRAPCVRCISPNVDVKTCKHSPHFEPLKTLKSYRLIHDDKEPTMGVYYNVYKEGFIQCNDPVYVMK